VAYPGYLAPIPTIAISRFARGRIASTDRRYGERRTAQQINIEVLLFKLPPVWVWLVKKESNSAPARYRSAATGWPSING
jgi:hypothetical protein